ncbi:MAG: HAD hydrolase family protein, partial [bacterium]|nr:HAD hydrolase family protein [bacterium]
TFDQTPADLERLADRVAARWPDLERPVLVVGVRTSGNYLGPLLAAALQQRGFADVEQLTFRPGQHWLASEARTLRAAAEGGALALVIDDPPKSWGSVGETVHALDGFGFERTSVAVVGQTVPSSSPVPAALAGRHTILMPWDEWTIRRQFEPAAVAHALQHLLGPSVHVGEVTPVSLGGELPGRGHCRLLYRVETDSDAGHESQLVYVKGVGLGYLGEHSAEVGRRLREFVPAVYGVRNGLMYREWLDEPSGLGSPDVDTQGVALRLTGYICSRARALTVAHDPSRGLRFRDAVWERAGARLSRAFRRAQLVMLPVGLAVTGTLLRTDAPAVIDGHTTLDAWFGDRTRPDRWRKIGFDEHAFSSRDRWCYDPIYDLAGAAATSDSKAFHDLLRRAYEQELGSPVDAERWFLYQLSHCEESVLDGQEDPPLERKMARCLQRYFEETVLGDVEPAAGGRLCALDLDGVLENSDYGFSAASPSAIRAVRTLLCHGYGPVIATGRSLEEVRDRCLAYHLPGGVAEYGSVIYVRSSSAVLDLVDAEHLKTIGAIRDMLAGLPGVRVDHGYQRTARAYVLDSRGRRRGLPAGLAERTLDEVGHRGVRFVQGQGQTDFVSATVSKGSALRALARELDVESSSDPLLALAVGDTESDLDMLAQSQLRFAPANADRHVRAAGIPVLRSAGQLAVWEATRRLLGHAPGACPTCTAPGVSSRSTLLLRTLALVEHSLFPKLPRAAAIVLAARRLDR